MGNNYDPVTLHKYLYANADPGNMIDPSGNFSMGSMMSAINVMGRLSTIATTTYDVFQLATGEGEVTAKQVGAHVIASLLGRSAGKVIGLFGKKVARQCRNSFPGETLVNTENGLVPIKDIIIGDLVWAHNEATGEQSLQEVTHLIQGDGSKELIDIYLLNGEKITTTYNHNFYLPEEMRWLEAHELVPGQKLLGQNRQLLEISYLGIFKQEAKVYNLSVNNDHTYYVGMKQALVHNANCDLSKIEIDGIYPFKPKPKLEINNAHVPGKPGYYPGKGTLPEDWQNAFDRYALFDGKAWWANGQNGAIYRYFETQGKWHWSGSTKDAMRPLSRNDVPSKVIEMLGGPSKGNL